MKRKCKSFLDRIMLDTESSSRADYFISHMFKVNLLFKTQVVTKSFTYSCGKSFLAGCHLLDDEIVRALLLLTNGALRWCVFETTNCMPVTR